MNKGTTGEQKSLGEQWNLCYIGQLLVDNEKDMDGYYKAKYLGIQRIFLEEY